VVGRGLSQFDLHVMDAREYRRDPLTIADASIALAKLWRAATLNVEANNGLIAYKPLIERRMKEQDHVLPVYTVSPKNRIKQGPARIGRLLGLWQTGHMKVNATMPYVTRFLREMERYTGSNSDQDNQLDATAYYRDIPGWRWNPTEPERGPTEDDLEMQRERDFAEELAGGKWGRRSYHPVLGTLVATN